MGSLEWDQRNMELARGDMPPHRIWLISHNLIANGDWVKIDPREPLPRMAISADGAMRYSHAAALYAPVERNEPRNARVGSSC
jgi:hypothetical protein